MTTPLTSHHRAQSKTESELDQALESRLDEMAASIQPRKEILTTVLARLQTVTNSVTPRYLNSQSKSEWLAHLLGFRAWLAVAVAVLAIILSSSYMIHGSSSPEKLVTGGGNQTGSQPSLDSDLALDDAEYNTLALMAYDEPDTFTNDDDIINLFIKELQI